ncbi:MAG TPA: GGDEF domain-containing protein, partial [Burkholderiaceae bacterium]
AIVDVDHFKHYNDTLGHVRGDDCLRKIGHALGAATRRPAEVTARYGGEEFAIILPGSNRADMDKFGNWICARIRSLGLAHPTSAVAPVVTISAGLVARVPDARDTPTAMLAAADKALYRAKENGRNRYELADMEPRPAPTLRLV